jgi:DHA1 family bicyclomycin/chloramphenicol resistance-like MFS transporter
MRPALLTVFCGFLLSVGAFSNDILLPSLFAIQADLATSIENVQLVVPVFMMISALGQLVFGPASDRFGRRAAIIAGLACYMTGTLIAMLSGSIAALLAGRGLQGFGSACCQVVARATLRDFNQGAELARAMALATAIFSFGPIGAPLLGIGLLSLGNWRFVFLAMLTFAGLLLAFTVLALKETNRQLDPGALKPQRLAEAFRRVAGHPQSRFFLVVASCQFFGIITYVAHSPRIFRAAFGLEGLPFALLFATTGLGIIVGQLANHRLIGLYGVLDTTRGASAVLAAVSVIVMALANTGVLTWWMFTALIFLFNAFFLVVFSNSASLVIDPHKQIAGLAASLFGAVTQLSGSLVMLATLPLIRGDVATWSLVLAGVSVAVLVALLRYRPGA